MSTRLQERWLALRARFGGDGAKHVALEEELRGLAEARADFVSLASHELRSPLAALVGAARTLQQRWPELSAEQCETFLALIVDEADRLASLVGDLFDTSRIDAGTFAYTFAEVDIGGLIEEAVATATAAQGEIEVVAGIAPGLPPLRADAARLRQVLANLLDNAVKYSPRGAVVEVDVTALDGRVSISVTDRGVGIAPEDQALIFEKFGRVHGPDAAPGTGLGLYIARSIAEAHGGTLGVSSRPGDGATFTLTMPVTPGDPA